MGLAARIALKIPGVVLASLIGFTIGIAIALRQVALIWIGRLPPGDRKPGGFPVAMSERAWRGFNRVSAVMVLGAACLAVAGWATALSLRWIALVSFAATCVCTFVCAPLIFLLNRPKALVPPALRSENGWLHDQE